MPEIGEIRRGLEIGRIDNRPLIWQDCQSCGKERWVPLLRGQPEYLRCNTCQSKDQQKRDDISSTLITMSIHPKPTVRPGGEAPQIGDFQNGSVLGLSDHKIYVRHACIDCKKERWVRFRHGQPTSTRCRSCEAKTPERKAKLIATLIRKGNREYPTPKGTLETPVVGDIRTGQEIGRGNWAKYIWQPCPICKKERWFLYRYRTNYANPHKIRCYCTRPSGDPLNPKIGDVQKQGRGFKTWQSCKKCGRERWTGLLNGKPDSVLCAPCSRSNPERIVKYMKTRYSNPRPRTYGQRKAVGPYVAVKLAPTNPYYSMCNSHGYVLEHRLVMAKHLKRCLLPHPYEIVHHKFGNKSDNRIEVLELTSNGQHIKDHSKGYTDGYEKGFTDGGNARIKELETENALLTKLVDESKLQSKEANDGKQSKASSGETEVYF